MIQIVLELGVECTYPVNEGTSAGALWLVVSVCLCSPHFDRPSMIGGAVFIAIMDALKGCDA